MAAENIRDSNINDPIPTQPIPDELFQRYYQIMTQHENIFKSIVENLEVWRPGLYGFGERHEVPTWTGIQDQLAGSEIYMLSKVMNAHDYVEHHVADHELGTPEDFNDIRELQTGRYVWNPETNRHDIIEDCVDEQRHDIPAHYTNGIYNWVPDHENHRWVKTLGRFRVWRGEGTEPIDRYHVVKHVPRFVQHLIYGEGDRIGLRVRSSENQKSFRKVSHPDDHHNSYSRNPEDIRGQLMLHSGASVTWEHEAVFRMSNDTDFKMTERSSIRMSQNALHLATDATRHEMHHHAYSRMTESSWFAMSESARFRMSDWAWVRMHDRTSFYMTNTANFEMRNNSRQAFSEDSIVVMRGNEYKGKNQYDDYDDRPHECLGWDGRPDKWFNPRETENINIINHDNYRFDSHGDHRRGTLPPVDHLEKMWPEYTVYPHAYTRGGARYVTKIDPVTQDSVVIGYEGSMSGTTGHNESHVDPNLWYKDEKGRWVVNNSAVDLRVPWNWANPAAGSTPNIRNTGPDWKGSPWLYMVGEPQIQMRIRAELFMTQDSSINMIHTSRLHTRNDSRMIMRGGDTWYNREGFNTNIDTPTKRYFESDAITHTEQCVPYKYYLDGEETIGWNGVYVEDETTYAPNRNIPRTLYELPPEDRYYVGSPWVYFAGQPRLQMRNQADVFMTENTTISMWHKARAHLRNSSNFIMRGSTDDDIGRWIDRRTPTTIDQLTNLPIARYAKPYKYYVTGIETIGMDGVTSPSHPDSLDTYSNNINTDSVPVAFRNETGVTRWELPDIDRPQPYSPWFYMAGQPRFQMRLNANFFMTEDSKVSMWHESKIHTRNKALIVMRGSDSSIQGRWQHRTSGNATQLIPDKYYIDGMDTIGMDGVTIGSNISTGSNETHSQNSLITAPNRNTENVTRWELPFEDRPKPLSPWLYMAGEPRFQMRLRSDLFMTEDTTISMWHNARIHTRNKSSIIMRGSTSNGTDITSGRWLHVGTDPNRLADNLVPDKYYVEGPETVGMDGVTRNGNPETYIEFRNNTGYELPAKDRPQVGSPWLYMAGQPRFQMRLDSNLFMSNSASISMWNDSRIHTRSESRIIMRGGQRWRNRAGHAILRPFKYYLDGQDTIGEDGVSVADWQTFNVSENHPINTRYELPDYDRPKANSPWWYMAGSPRFQMRLDANFFMTEETSVSMWHRSRVHTRNDSLLIMRGGTRWYDKFADSRATPSKYYQDGPNTIGVDGVSVSDWQTFNVSENTIENTRWELPFKDRPKNYSPWLYMAGQPRFHMRRYADIFMTDNTTVSMWHEARIHVRNESLIVMRGGRRWFDRIGDQLERPFKYYLDGPDTIGRNGVDVSDQNNPDENVPNTRWELPFKDRPRPHSPWWYMAGSPRFQMRLDANFFMTETSSVSMWHDARVHTRNESRIIMRGGQRWMDRQAVDITTPFKQYINGAETIGPDGKTTSYLGVSGSAGINFELPLRDRPKANSPWFYMAGQPRFQMRNQAHIFMTEDSSIDMWHRSNIHTRNDSKIIMRGGSRWITVDGLATPTIASMGPHMPTGFDRQPTTNRFYFDFNVDNTVLTETSWMNTPLFHIHGNDSELPVIDRRVTNSPWLYMAGQPRLQMRVNSSLFMTDDSDFRMYNHSIVELSNNAKIDMNTDSHFQGTGSGHLHFTNNPPTYTRLNRVGYEAHLNAKTGTVGRNVLPGQRLLTIGTNISRTHAFAFGIPNIGLDDLRRPGKYTLEDLLFAWGPGNPNPTDFQATNRDITNLINLSIRLQSNINALDFRTHSFATTLPQFNHISNEVFHGNERRSHLEVFAHSYGGEPNIDLVQRLTTAPHNGAIPSWLDPNHRLLGHFNRPMTFQRSWNRNNWTPWVKLLDSLDRFDASIIHTGILPIERGGNSRNTIQRGEMYYAHSETTNLIDPSLFTGNFTTINAPVVTRAGDTWLHNRQITLMEQIAPITPEKPRESRTRNYDFPKVLIHNRDNVDQPPEWRDMTDITARRRMSFGRNVQTRNTPGSWASLNDYHRMGVYDLNGILNAGTTPFTSFSGNHELTVIKPDAGTDGANSVSGITIQRMMTSSGRIFVRSLNGSSIVSSADAMSGAPGSNVTNGWTELTTHFADGFRVTLNNANPNTPGPRAITMHPQDMGATNVTASNYARNDNSGHHAHRIRIDTARRVIGHPSGGGATSLEIGFGPGINFGGVIQLGNPTSVGHGVSPFQNFPFPSGNNNLGSDGQNASHTHSLDFPQSYIEMQSGSGKRLFIMNTAPSAGARGGDVWIQTT